MSIWSAIKNTLLNFVFSFLGSLGSMIMKSGGNLLMDLSDKWVKAAEDTGKTGDEKFAMVYESIIKEFDLRGFKTWTQTAVEGAILASVAKLKEGKL